MHLVIKTYNWVLFIVVPVCLKEKKKRKKKGRKKKKVTVEFE